MKKIGVINKEISSIIAGMGHMQMLTVCDAGLPIPVGVQRIDLALKEGLPGFVETLEVISKELKVEKIIVASEMARISPEIRERMLNIFPEETVVEISHEKFKELTKESVAIIRTGEYTPYANVILVSGVVF